MLTAYTHTAEPGNKAADTQRALPRFRNATFADYGQIAKLESRHRMRVRSYEEWTHLWVDNPIYQQYPDWPIGWVFEAGDNEIVGHIANVPLSYDFAGCQILAATSADLVVDAHYRLYAFQLLGHFLSQKRVQLFVSTTANRNSSKAFETFRVPRVPVGAWNRSSFWITNYHDFLTRLLTKKRVPLAGALSLPLTLVLRLKDTINRTPLTIKHHDFELTSCDSFDDRFDDFWTALRRSHTSTLLATRSRAVLEWHFKHPLAHKRALIVIAATGSQILAYSLFFRYEYSTLGLKSLRLIDFQALGGRNELLVPMLERTLQCCKTEDIHMLEAFGFAPDKQVIIDRMAPYSRKFPWWPYFYKVNDHDLALSLREPTVWDPSCFDGDASL